MDTIAKKPRLSLKALLVLTICVTVATYLRYTPHIDLVFDGGHESMLNGRYYAGIQKGWLVEMDWHPRVTPIPTAPVSGRTYANHPPLAHYITHVFVREFGFRERSFRFVGILFSWLSQWLLVYIIGKRFGFWPATLALGTFIAMPVTLHHGMTASYAPMLLVWGLLLYVGWTSKARRIGLALGWLSIFVSAYTDWATLFYLPGVLLLGKSLDLGWRRSLVHFLTATLSGFALFCGQLIYWAGSLQAVWDQLTYASATAMSQAAFAADGFYDVLFQNQLTTLTWFGVVILIAGALWSLVRILRRANDAMDALFWMFLLASLIKTAVFPIQAYHHDFWTYGLVVSVAIAVGQISAGAAWRQAVLGLGVVAFLWHGIDTAQKRIEAEYQERSLAIADRINAKLGADCIILIAGDMSPLSFYLDGWTVDGIPSATLVKELYGKWKSSDIAMKRFALIAPLAFEKEILDSGEWQHPEGMQRVVKGPMVFTWLDRN